MQARRREAASRSQETWKEWFKFCIRTFEFAAPRASGRSHFGSRGGKNRLKRASGNSQAKNQTCAPGLDGCLESAQTASLVAHAETRWSAAVRLLPCKNPCCLGYCNASGRWTCQRPEGRAPSPGAQVSFASISSRVPCWKLAPLSFASRPSAGKRLNARRSTASELPRNKCLW